MKAKKIVSPYARTVRPMIFDDGSFQPPLVVGGFEILPFFVKHDVDNLGYWVRSLTTGETLVYFTDCTSVRYRFPWINYLLAECNYCTTKLTESVQEGRISAFLASRIRRSHMSLAALTEFLGKNDLKSVKEVWLIHLSDQNSDEKEIRDTVQRMTGTEVYIA